MNPKKNVWLTTIIVALTLCAPALADFSFDEIPTFVEDQGPVWIFEILTTIFVGLVQALFSGFVGIT